MTKELVLIGVEHYADKLLDRTIDLLLTEEPDAVLVEQESTKNVSRLVRIHSNIQTLAEMGIEYDLPGSEVFAAYLYCKCDGKDLYSFDQLGSLGFHSRDLIRRLYKLSKDVYLTPPEKTNKFFRTKKRLWLKPFNLLVNLSDLLRERVMKANINNLLSHYDKIAVITGNKHAHYLSKLDNVKCYRIQRIS